MDYALRSPLSAPNAAALVKQVADPLLRVSNDGVRFLADLAAPMSYPGGPASTRQEAADPVNGAAIYDMSGHEDGIVRTTGDIGYSGGGFDFSAVTAQNNFIEIPGSVATDIFAPFGGANQRFAVLIYLKMPILAAWDDVPQFFNSAPLLSWCDKTGVNWGAADIDLVSLTAHRGGMYVKRMTAPGVYDDIEVTLEQCQVHQGRVTQVLIYRSDTAYGMRLRSNGGTTLLIQDDGAASSVDPSGRVARVGISNIMGWPDTVTDAHDFRIYAIAMENLARSGRDPIAMADADYSRRIGRGAFS